MLLVSRQKPAVPGTHPTHSGMSSVSSHDRNPWAHVRAVLLRKASQVPDTSWIHGPVRNRQFGHGTGVGAPVGAAVGFAVGSRVGEAVMGAVVGARDVGRSVDDAVGLVVGEAVGDTVGNAVGDAVGLTVGETVGDTVGVVHSAVTVADPVSWFENRPTSTLWHPTPKATEHCESSELAAGSAHRPLWSSFPHGCVMMVSLSVPP
mmetsp:Transcript_12834/g.38552  ORF Transcript_12834/g.38552 Transcript_12834/m.38552 type:complete len:205 (+) Transcript_12834:8372-8986(+)